TQTSPADDNMMVSMPRRIVVRSDDVTGVELKLRPTASIAGRAVVEASSFTCDPKSNRSMEEILVSAYRINPEAALPANTQSTSTHAVNERGEFLMQNLRSGNYRFNTATLDENRYVKSITAPGKTPGARYDASRGGLSLKLGDKVTGLTLT